PRRLRPTGWPSVGRSRRLHALHDVRGASPRGGGGLARASAPAAGTLGHHHRGRCALDASPDRGTPPQNLPAAGAADQLSGGSGTPHLHLLYGQASGGLVCAIRGATTGGDALALSRTGHWPRCDGDGIARGSRLALRTGVGTGRVTATHQGGGGDRGVT